MDDLRKTKFKDIKIECVDCGITFTWVAGEQLFYASKGLAQPKRCKPCRAQRHNSLVPGGGV